MRDELAKWKKVRKLEPQELGSRRLSVKAKTGEDSGPDPNKEPC